jgi:U3 small nucleolar ribonucleoprotein component
MVVAVVVAAAVRFAPDYLFERPDATIYRERHVEDGLTEPEAMRRFGIHMESEELRAEKIQEERRKAKRKARSQGHLR